MLLARRTAVSALAVALLASGCGGPRGVSIDPLAQRPAEDVLSPCEPSGEQETTTLVEASGEHPPTTTMLDAVGDHPDATFMIEQLQEEGVAEEDALHRMYAQHVGQQLFADAERLPGFVTGAYARPEADEPFQLSFSGPLPDELDPDAYDLSSFGLEVTTGADGFDHDGMTAAFDAAAEVGIQTISGSFDETSGTGVIEVIAASEDQVEAWEAALDDPSRWCLVLASRTVPCDDAVIADARARAERQGEVLPLQQDDEGPTAARAEEVGLSYLGLTLDAAEDKAAQEDRAVRVTTQDGVQLPSTDDLQPGRLSLAVCDGIVVDTHMDLEPGA